MIDTQMLGHGINPTEGSNIMDHLQNCNVYQFQNFGIMNDLDHICNKNKFMTYAEHQNPKRVYLSWWSSSNGGQNSIHFCNSFMNSMASSTLQQRL